MYSNEIQIKLQRLGTYLAANALDGVLLQNRANFAWITGGRDNHVVLESEGGVAGILATADRLVCLTNHIESPRFRTEELADMGIEVIDFPWWSPAEAAEVVRRVVGERKIASDNGAFGIAELPPGFAKLRWSLTDMEIQRYRFCGQLTSAAIESASRQIQPGESEFDIAARLEFEIQRTGASPYVVLVATDRRIREYRHPTPTAKKLEKHAMLVLCGEYRGLICSCTRFVHFGPVPTEISERHQAVCNVDAAVNLATKPGRTIGDIFRDLQAAYAENGHPDQWRYHHQGGSTGYAGRDIIGTPFIEAPVLANQAFAWNPSITGTKSEDTILVTDNGIELLTQPSEAWPKTVGHFSAGQMVRSDILVR